MMMEEEEEDIDFSDLNEELVYSLNVNLNLDETETDLDENDDKLDIQ
jgi:hypothetical protein